MQTKGCFDGLFAGFQAHAWAVWMRPEIFTDALTLTVAKAERCGVPSAVIMCEFVVYDVVVRISQIQKIHGQKLEVTMIGFKIGDGIRAFELKEDEIEKLPLSDEQIKYLLSVKVPVSEIEIDGKVATASELISAGLIEETNLQGETKYRMTPLGVRFFASQFDS